LRFNELRESTFTSEGKLLAGGLVAFLAVMTLAGADLFTDLREGTTPGHVSAEGGVILVGLFGALVAARRLVLTLRKVRVTEEEARSLAERLERTAADAARWRSEAQDLMAGLGAALDQQFERWKLSPSEKEVGLLLLKGLSHKEVAAARSTTEATTRQQARALYKKAGLTGRHDLAAFFLEDLMLPTDDRSDRA
jgi:DNA-binding CsgD family transcriptional regulator